MRKYEKPDIKIAYFITNNTMTDEPYVSINTVSADPMNLLTGNDKVKVGSIDFQSLK